MRNKLFKMGSFEEDLAKGMQEQLLARRNDNLFGISKIAQAVELLNKASELFDAAGKYAEAEAVIRLLEKMAHQPDAKLQWKDLSKEEEKFYHSLPADKKRELKQLLQVSGDTTNDFDDFVRQIKKHYAEEANKLPEAFEMKSLFAPEREEEEVMLPRGEDVIEIAPLPLETEKQEADRLMKMMASAVISGSKKKA